MSIVIIHSCSSTEFYKPTLFSHLAQDLAPGKRYADIVFTCIGDESVLGAQQSSRCAAGAG